jgi:predicted porin
VYKTTGLQYKWPLSLCLFIPCVYGADDNESWTSVSFEKKLPYSLKLEFEQELRLDDQLSTFKQTFSELSLSYKVFDGFSLQVPYRYSTYENKIKQRLSIGGSYKYSFKPLSLKYRARIQRTYEKEENPEDMIRNKCTIEYKFDKNIEPYVSSELFHSYNEDPVQFDEYRISFGLTVDIMERSSIKIFYIFKKEDLTKSPDEIGVFGLAYSFKM